jgi:hypothetical protein
MRSYRIMIPQNIYIGRFLNGKHRIQDYRLEVTFCQLYAFRNVGFMRSKKEKGKGDKSPLLW